MCCVQCRVRLSRGICDVTETCRSEFGYFADRVSQYDLSN